MADYIETSPLTAELLSAASWIVTAPTEIAARIDAPADMRGRLVEIMITSNGRKVLVDVRMTLGLGRSLSCHSGKTLVEAIRAVRADLHEKGLE